MGINTVVVSGRVVKDAELKNVGETDLVKFTVVYSEKYKEKEYSTFLDCNLFGGLGKHILDKLTKGTTVTVEGKLRQENWESQGVKRSKIVIMVNNIVI